MTSSGRPRRSPQPAFWTHWELLQLSDDAGVYAHALTHAICVSRTTAVASELVHFDVPVQAVVVWMVLSADDLGCALDRSLQRLLSLLDLAGLEQPGRFELLAGRLGQNTKPRLADGDERGED